MAPLKGPRTIVSLSAPPSNEEIDRIMNGSGSARLNKLTKDLPRTRGDRTRLEALLRKHDIARILTLIAEDAWQKYDRSEEGHDSVTMIGDALKRFKKALLESARGRSHSRDRLHREQARPLGPMPELVELVVETLREEKRPSNQEKLLANKLMERPHLLTFWEDRIKKMREPVTFARHLLKQYKPYIEEHRLRTKRDVRFHFGRTVRQRKAQDPGPWSR